MPWFREAEIEGIPVAVQRSGWSKQGGFEIYLRDGSRGGDLWSIVKEAGQPWGIGPGAPATAERTESGLVSVGGDTDDETNPFEVRMGKYVDLDVPDDVVGIQALRRIKEEGPKRHQLGVVLDEPDPIDLPFHWFPMTDAETGERIGDQTNVTWSRRMEKNIGFALVSSAVQPGAKVKVDNKGKVMTGTLQEMPFL